MHNLPVRYTDVINRVWVLAYQQLTNHHAALNDLKASLTFELNTRLRTSAGRCWYNADGYVIEFASHVMDKDTDEQFYNTVSHEMAHAISAFVFKQRGHGTYWNRIFVMLGGNGKRCHDRKHVEGNIKMRIIVEKNGKELRITKREFNKYGEIKLMSMGYKIVAYLHIKNGVVIAQQTMGT